MINYYEILGVSEDATKEEIKKAYYELIKKYHPDVNPSNSETLKMVRLINEAYQILSDDVRRMDYDKELHEYIDNSSKNTEDFSSETEKQSYEDIMRDYDENTKRMVERESYKIIIEEELSKFDLIIATKNELIINAIINYDVVKFYQDINELIDIAIEFYKTLEELNPIIIRLDMYEYFDKIEAAKKKIFEFIETAPTNQIECIEWYLKDELKEILGQELSIHKKKCDEIKERILDICYECSNTTITHMDFNKKLSIIMSDLNEEKNYIETLMEGIKILNDEQLNKEIACVLSEFDIMSIKIPSNYQVAMEIGKSISSSSSRLRQNLFNEILQNIKDGREKIVSEISGLAFDLKKLSEKDEKKINHIIDNVEEYVTNIKVDLSKFQNMKDYSIEKYQNEYRVANDELKKLMENSKCLEDYFDTENDNSKKVNYEEQNLRAYNLAQISILNERVKLLFKHIEELQSYQCQCSYSDLSIEFYSNIIDIMKEFLKSFDNPDMEKMIDISCRRKQKSMIGMWAIAFIEMINVFCGHDSYGVACVPVHILAIVLLIMVSRRTISCQEDLMVGKRIGSIKERLSQLIDVLVDNYNLEKNPNGYLDKQLIK